MGKTLSIKLNDNEKKRVESFLKKKKVTPSELLRKALWQYIIEVNHEVNLTQQENKNEKVNLFGKKVNLKRKEKNSQEVNQVNHSVQILENYELLRNYKEEIDWMRNRIEFFEGFCKDLHEKSILNVDVEKKKKPLLTGIRM